MAQGRWVTSNYLADDRQAALNHGINIFGAQLFAESLENLPAEVQDGGFTLMVHDHKGKVWYVTGSTKEPEIITEEEPKQC